MAASTTLSLLKFTPPPVKCYRAFPTQHLHLHSFSATPLHVAGDSKKLNLLRCLPSKKSTPITIQQQETKRNPVETAVDEFLKALIEALKKPAVAAVVLGALLLMCDPNYALAASGGRMGGRSFSSRRSSSSSSSSSRRGYSGSSSSSRRGYSSSSPSYSHSSLDDLDDTIGKISILLIIVVLLLIIVVAIMYPMIPKNSVLKLQVGLLGSARSLQKALNKIADTADTSSPEGLSYILTETSISLLRHPDYCISGYSSVEAKKNLDDCEKRFNQISIEERGKFDEETLINVDNKKQKSTASQKSEGISNEYIVVTMLVAAEGVHKLPTISGIEDLKKAMKMIGSIPSNKILAAEVLWTPQDENDTFTERELLEDYPQLKPL